MASNGVPFYISFIPQMIIRSLCSRRSGILHLEWDLASSDASWNNDAPRPYNMTNSKNKGWELLFLSLFLSPSLFSQYAPIVSPATAHRSSQKQPPSRRLCIQWPSFHPLSKTNHSMTHFFVSHHFSVRMCFAKLCICLRSKVQRHFICAFGYGKILLAV